MTKSAAPRMTDLKLLRKIQKHILAEPNRLAMGIVSREGKPNTKLCETSLGPSVYNAFNPFEKNQTFPDCGTMACILGWARILGKSEDVYVADSLINASGWPEEFSSRYRKAKTPLTRARIAAERISHFIKTKGAE